MTGLHFGGYAVWGRRLLHAACVCLWAPAALGQTWEMLPLLPFTLDQAQMVDRVDFLRAEGEGASNPDLDSLLRFSGSSGRFFLYNPSGAAGSAGDNGIWGAWHPLCENARCIPRGGVVTSSNSILFGTSGRTLSRSTDRGRTWNHNVDSLYALPIYESALPSLAGPDGQRGLIAIVDGRLYRSSLDGAPGTWERVGFAGDYSVEAVGEVPPSAALPSGRLLMGIWNGVTGSTDGGLSFQPTSLYQQGGYITHSFAFVPVAGHPYGGVAFAGVDHAALAGENVTRAEVHRSDDGGQTWTLARHFTPEETGLPPLSSDTGPVYMFNGVALAAAPDGALWAGVHYTAGPVAPGVILRSSDLGATWSRADEGFTGYPGAIGYPPSTPEQPFGWRVRAFTLARDGRLYAATDRGVWHTTASVVSAEASPEAPGGVSLSVRPNPSSGGATVTLSLASAQEVRVAVVDALGREVAVVLSGTLGAGAHTAPVGSSLAPGVYVVRASDAAGRVLATARVTVTR